MGYYLQGDYYRRAGDPGIFGAIGGAIKGAVGGFISGGPFGAVKGAVTGGIAGAIGKTTSTIATPSGVTPISLMLPPAPGGLAGSVGVKIGPVQVNPLAALPGGAPLVSAASGSQAPRGYHLNKQASPRGPKGSYWVRNRSMNPLNPRALRRGLRRQQGAVALMRRVLKGSGITIGRRSFPKKARRR
jgi:hypothetical protein